MHRIILQLTLGTLLAAAAATAFAQFGGAGGGRRGRGGDTTAAARTTDRAAGPESASQLLRDRLYDLRLRLLITQEQSVLWERFYNCAWDLSGRAGFTQAQASGDQTAPQAVEQRAVQAQERAAQLRALADATVQLYAALTPDQRQIADRDLPAVVP